MHLAGVHPDLGLVALADPARAVEGHDQLGPQRLAVEVLLQLGQLLADLVGRLEGDVGVRLVAQPLHHVDGRGERRLVADLVGVDHVGVLEVLGPQAGDQQPLVLRLGGLVLGDRDRAERQLDLVALHRGGQEVHRRGADEARDEQVGGVLVELARGRVLLEHPALEHRDPVAQRHRLGLVVGDVDRGDAQPLLQPRDLRAHLPAELGVEVRQRLVEEERLRLTDDRAAHRHALALTAGQVARLALEVLVELEGLRRLAHLLVDLGVRGVGEPQRERDVLVDGQVGVEGVVLEDHRQVAVAGRQVVDPVAADDHVPAGDVLEPHDHPQQGGLPAPRRTDEDQELSVLDVDAHVVDGGEAVAVLLDDVLHLDGSHELITPSLRRRSGRRRSCAGTAGR